MGPPHEYNENKLGPPQEGSRPKTLYNFRLFILSEDHPEEISIWDFSTRSWARWHPDENKESAQALLWRAARVISKILHFCSHRCSADNIREYIPDKYVSQVFQPAEWAHKLSIQLALFNSDVLKKAVETKVVPDWKNKDGFPVHEEAQLTTKIEKDAKEKARLLFFEEQARSDDAALTIFMTPLVEALDWKTIRDQGTASDQQIYQWAIQSLAFAANLVSELLGDNPCITKPAASNKRNPQWLAMGDAPNRPAYKIVPLAGIFWPVDSTQVVGTRPQAKRNRIPDNDSSVKRRQLFPTANPASLTQAVKKPQQLEPLKIPAQPDLSKNTWSERSSSNDTPFQFQRRSPPDSANSTYQAPRAESQKIQNDSPTVLRRSSAQAVNAQQPPQIRSQLSLTKFKTSQKESDPSTNPQSDRPKNNPQSAALSRPLKTNLPNITTPNLTTSKITNWDFDALCGFLTRMKISPINLDILTSYHFPQKGKLTGDVLLLLKKKDIFDENLEILKPRDRKRLWRIISKLQARVLKNDRELSGE